MPHRSFSLPIRRFVPRAIALALAPCLALAGCGGGDPDSQSLDVHVNQAKPAEQDDGGGPGVAASADAARASDQAVTTGEAAGEQAAGQDTDAGGAGYRPGAIEQNDRPKIARDGLKPDAYAPDAQPGLEQVQEGGDDQATPQQ